MDVTPMLQTQAGCKTKPTAGPPVFDFFFLLFIKSKSLAQIVFELL